MAEKEGFKSGMKERVGDEKLIIITISCVNTLSLFIVMNDLL